MVKMVDMLGLGSNFLKRLRVRTPFLVFYF